MNVIMNLKGLNINADTITRENFMEGKFYG